MPHQRLIADIAGELDPNTGRLAYSEVVVIGPRQVTGKTELLMPVMTHRCTAFNADLVKWVRDNLGHDLPDPGAQRVLYTAQTADDARKKWRDVHVARLKQTAYYTGRPREFNARLRQNQEALIWRNGSMWSPASTTGKTGGTGDSLDLAVIDEAWSRPDNRTELGMRPATMTRDWRQMWVMSMIPGLSRALPGTWPYLAGKRQVGRARVDADVRYGTAFFDFSAADGLDPGDPATWWSCMPGLGITVPEQTVREDYEAMAAAGTLVDFEAEYLGWAPQEKAPKWKLIRETTWEDLRDPLSAIDGPVALAVEVSEDRMRAWIGVAGLRADGHWHVEIVEPGHRVPAGITGMDWLERRLVELVEDWGPCTVVIDPRRPANSLIVPLRNKGIDVLTPNQGQIAGACGRFYDATGENEDPPASDDAPEVGAVRVFHLGQRELDGALAVAIKYDLGEGAFTFVKRGANAEIGPLYCVVLAMHGYEVKAPPNYDLLDSVPRAEGQCEDCEAYPVDGVLVHHADCPARG